MIIFLFLLVCALFLLCLFLREVAAVYRLVVYNLLGCAYIQRFGETDQEYRSRIDDIVEQLYEKTHKDLKRTSLNPRKDNTND